MSADEIEYRVKSADTETIRGHLAECAGAFVPPLHGRVDIGAYAQKIFDRAVTVEAWANESLVGLVAIYLNDPERRSGFITSVSVAAELVGRGIATQLLRRSIAYASTLGFRSIRLEVEPNHERAVNLYRRAGFRELERRAGYVVMMLEVEGAKIGSGDRRRAP